MKTVKHLTVALAVLLCFGVSSCSNDDDNVNTSDLFGTWELVHEKGWEKENGKITDTWDDDADAKYFEAGRVEFLEDYTSRSYSYSSSRGQWVLDDEINTFSVKGNKLYMYGEYYGEAGESGTIKTLNSSQLVVEFSETYTEDRIKYEYYVVVTYKKIK